MDETYLTGGRATLASIQDGPDDVPEPSKEVIVFRRILNTLKRNILDGLDKESLAGNEDIQHIDKLKDIIDTF